MKIQTKKQFFAVFLAAVVAANTAMPAMSVHAAEPAETATELQTEPEETEASEEVPEEEGKAEETEQEEEIQKPEEEKPGETEEAEETGETAEELLTAPEEGIAVYTAAPKAVYLGKGMTLNSADLYYHNGENGAPGTIDKNPEGANANYDPAAGVLKLQNLNVANGYLGMGGTADYAIQIQLTGENRIAGEGSTQYPLINQGRNSKLSVEISGDGTLTAEQTNESKQGSVLYAKNLTVGGNATLKLNNRDVEESYYAYGLNCEGSLTVKDNGTVTSQAASGMIATGGVEVKDNGTLDITVMMKNMSAIGIKDSSVTISGGQVTIHTPCGDGIGTRSSAKYALEMSGGKLDIQVGSSDYTSPIGAVTAKKIAITGGEVNLTLTKGNTFNNRLLSGASDGIFLGTGAKVTGISNWTTTYKLNAENRVQKSNGSDATEIKGSKMEIRFSQAMNFNYCDGSEQQSLEEAPTEVPDWKGNTFAGWSTVRDDASKIVTEYEGGQNYYAVWKNQAGNVVRTELLVLGDEDMADMSQGWSWNAASGVLSLHDTTILSHVVNSDSASNGWAHAITFAGKSTPSEVVIELNGRNVAGAVTDEFRPIISADSRADVTYLIKGAGSLELTAPENTPVYGFAGKNLKMESGALQTNVQLANLSGSFELTDGSIEIGNSSLGQYMPGYGLSAMGDICVRGGELTVKSSSTGISGKNIEITGGTTSLEAGIGSEIKASGTITIGQPEDIAKIENGPVAMGTGALEDTELAGVDAAQPVVITFPRSTVTFDTRDCDFTVEPLQEVHYMATVAAPKTPEKEGSVLSWYKDAEHIEKWNFETDPIAEDVILYAGWQTREELLDGSMKLTVEQVGNPPKTELVTSREEMIRILVESGALSTEELNQVAQGAELEIVLRVKNADETISGESKALLEKASSGWKNGTYMEIELVKYLTVNGVTTETPLHKLAREVKIAIQIPDELILKRSGYKRSYRVLRNHEGNVEILKGSYSSKSKIFTFETDRFSEYALVYKDRNASQSSSGQSHTSSLLTAASPKTGDSGTADLWLLLVLASGAGTAAVILKRRKKFETNH